MACFEIRSEIREHFSFEGEEVDLRFVVRNQILNLSAFSYGAKEVAFAQAAFSNLIGGIGYFYGSSRVQSAYTKEPVPYWKAPLYTAVPSR